MGRVEIFWIWTFKNHTPKNKHTMKTPEEKPTKKQILQAIRKADCHLEATINNIGWSSYWTKLIAMATAEEKAHRKFCGTRDNYAITVADSVKLFAVKRVLEVWKGGKLPEIKDFLGCQASWFYAASIAVNYPEQIKQALINANLSAEEIEMCVNADYAELVK